MGVSYALACASGVQPQIFRVLSFQMASRNDDVSSFHGKPLRVEVFSSKLEVPDRHCYHAR